MTRFKSLLDEFKRFARSEDGVSTVEFVIVVPFFFFIFISAIEAQVYSIRQVMIDRALDLTARDVRVGFVKEPSHDDLKDRICEYSTVVPNCDRDIRLDMTIVDPRAWAAPPADVPCRDRAEENPDEIVIEAGQNNELMILRVCVVLDPTFTFGGLGRKTGGPNSNTYALTASTAYVLEPFN